MFKCLKSLTCGSPSYGFDGLISSILVQSLDDNYIDCCTALDGVANSSLSDPRCLLRKLLVSFSVDINHLLCDDIVITREEHKILPRTINVFILSFIDFTNNILQGPCRTLFTVLTAGMKDFVKLARGSKGGAEEISDRHEECVDVYVIAKEVADVYGEGDEHLVKATTRF
ncbi:hypothetical protein PIB30_053115 [Stylosanthes scabra]|uniref:Uncharacterized protein n=1 Tax=Stylosanthes scabra TaxID=79078 RepID=A0ABU6WGN0_9FABA|nr:hypothetical protein [Stylosanthes scabra]